jgi:hypothetical protein
MNNTTDLKTAQTAMREAYEILLNTHGPSTHYDIGRAMGTILVGLRMSGDLAPVNDVEASERRAS